MTAGAPLVDWAVAGRALPGQAESGDLFTIVPGGGQVLLAVMDGLGHGPNAAAASRLAVANLQTYAGQGLEQAIRQCHQALLKTRGVVLSLALVNGEDDTLSWVGVGNVEGVLLRADPAGRRESLLLRGGVVGYQLPPLRVSVLPVSPGDTLILATDGVRVEFISGLDGRRAPQPIADDLLDRFARESDDALVLVARYLGRTS